jgi:hypothetical protein
MHSSQSPAHWELSRIKRGLRENVPGGKVVGVEIAGCGNPVNRRAGKARQVGGADLLGRLDEAALAMLMLVRRQRRRRRAQRDRRRLRVDAGQGDHEGASCNLDLVQRYWQTIFNFAKHPNRKHTG